MQTLEQLVAWARTLWSEASSLIRALVTAGVVLVVGGLIYALTLTPQHDFTPLSDKPLSLAQVGRITAELDKRSVAYKVDSSGTQVLVPRQRRGDLLASLASSGVSVQPESVEALENNLLATDFQQREQVRRHLEQSLGRDISSMTGIEWAEVHISPGSDSIFSRAKRPGAASVVVRIRPGFTFPKERAISLKHLVAQAAHRYGVTSHSVAVVDHEARTLAAAEDDTELGINTKSLALQRETEDDLAARIRMLLEPVVGEGRVRVQVRTRMNLNRVTETAEEYDPDNATVRQERKTSETSRSNNKTPIIAAGTTGNLPNAGNDNVNRNQSQSNQDRSINETNFLVPKVVRHTKRAMGSIERMSIAVLVDAAAFAPEPPTAEGEAVVVPPKAESGGDVPTEEPESTDDPLPPRPNQEMLLALVRDAVAFDTKRGDTVTLSFQPFIRIRSDAPRVHAQPPPSSWPASLAVAGACLLGFAMIAGAIYMSKRRSDQEQLLEQANASAEDQASADEAEQEPPPETLLRDRVRQVSSRNVPATVEIVKGWLSTTPQKG